ncbi:MAG TPA: hypothetical protein VHU41_21000, partial [Thermoanaerobaculia bacterium]|nr:hypothetical protein [Thermoanaerobaculia bacterium]
IDSYGWRNLDHMNRDFLGYVMWVQVPPYDHDIMNWQANVPPKRAPTAQEQTLMELGHDFFGLMKTARHGIGQALLYEPHAKPMEIEAGEFDFSEFAALMSLIAAADRLRDFLITAVLGAKTKEEGQLNASYVALETAGFCTIAADLRAGFTAAKAARDARNAAVHGLSTVPGRVHREIIERDRKAFEEQSWGKEADGTYAEMIAKWDQRVQAERAKITARAQLLCDTYTTLIKTGEVCIRAEYFYRKRGDVGAS